MPTAHHRPQSRKRRGFAVATTVAIVVVVLLIVGGVYLAGRGSDAATRAEEASLALVRRGDFEVTIPASGELAAMRQAEISSQLDGRAVILEIVDEGTQVKEGDLLIHLDDKEIKDKIRDLKVELDNRTLALETAQTNLRIKETANTNELELLDVDVSLAELQLYSWEHGDHPSDLKSLESEVLAAEKDAARLEERFEDSRRLLEQQFISEDEFKRDEIDLIRARNRLQEAQTALSTYTEFEQIKMRRELESAITKAKNKRAETAERNANEIRNLQGEVDNRRIALEKSQADLADAELQLENSTIYAPQAGLVVYASSLQSSNFGRGDREPPPMVGTELRKNRTIMVIPDTSRMVAEVKVNEALSGRIEQGQRAIVYSDALPGMAIEGRVLSVGVLAEGGSWRDPNRRDYTVRIELINTEGMGLKPSMRCRAEIEVEDVIDATHVPVQSIVREGGTSLVYVPVSGGYMPKRVRTGRSSELYVEIRDGVAVGETVLVRRPRAEEIVRNPELEEELAAAKQHEASGGPVGGTGRRPGGMGGGAGAAMMPSDVAAPSGGAGATPSPGGSGPAGQGANGGRRGPGGPGGPGGGRPGGAQPGAGGGAPSAGSSGSTGG